jgi:hypothetical protein
MHKEVLSKQQLELLPLIKLFAKEYYLVGGTAIVFGDRPIPTRVFSSRAAGLRGK